MEYSLEEVHGKNRRDAVHHKSCGHGGHGTEVVQIVEVDARCGEIVAPAADAARGGGGDDEGLWRAAKPFEAIGLRRDIPPKPPVALVVYVLAVSAVAVVRGPILSAVSVYRGRPNAMTAATRMLEHNGFGESVGSEDSIESGDEPLARHRLGNRDDKELGIAETLAYPKH